MLSYCWRWIFHRGLWRCRSRIHRLHNGRLRSSRMLRSHWLYWLSHRRRLPNTDFPPWRHLKLDRVDERMRATLCIEEVQTRVCYKWLWINKQCLIPNVSNNNNVRAKYNRQTIGELTLDQSRRVRHDPRYRSQHFHLSQISSVQPVVPFGHPRTSFAMIPCPWDA